MDITFYGLQKLYVSIFEKHGWIMLAKHNGTMEQTKVDEYARKIEKWLESSRKKLLSENVTGLYREDIEIMRRNMNRLNDILHNKQQDVAKGGSLDFDSDGFITNSDDPSKEGDNKKYSFYGIYGIC